MGRILDWLLDWSARLAALILLLQVVSITIDVLCRYFLDHSFEFVVPFTSWSLIYVAFLGAGWLQREGGHVRVDIMLERASPSVRRGMDLFGLAIGTVCCAVLVWYGAKVTYYNYDQKIVDFYSLDGVQVYLIYVAIPVGAALFLVQIIRDMHRLLTSPPVEGA